MSDYIAQMYGGSATANIGNYAATGAGLNALGAVTGGFTRASAMRSNAATMGTEGTIAQTQGFEQEAQQRRAGSMALGRETAAVGQAGGGYGGSASRAVRQSALNMQLDALNIRYKSQLQKWAYAAQGRNDRYGANVAVAQGLGGGAAALLRGHAGNYIGGGEG